MYLSFNYHRKWRPSGSRACHSRPMWHITVTFNSIFCFTPCSYVETHGEKKRIKSQSASLTLGGSLWPLMSRLLWFPLQNQESTDKLEEERQSMGLKLISHFLNRIYSCYERLLAVMIVNILESQSWPLQFEVLTVIISHLESAVLFLDLQSPNYSFLQCFQRFPIKFYPFGRWV